MKKINLRTIICIMLITALAVLPMGCASKTATPEAPDNTATNAANPDTEPTTEASPNTGLLGSMSSATAPARHNIYIYIDGIEGESNDSKHAKWIDVLDFSHGATHNGTEATSYVSSRGTFEPFVFVHEIDKATPKLQESCMKGNRIPTVELSVCRQIAGVQVEIYKVKLEDVQIVSAEVKTMSFDDGSFKIVEEVTLLAQKQTWTATTVTIDNANGGNSEASYDQSRY